MTAWADRQASIQELPGLVRVCPRRAGTNRIKPQTGVPRRPSLGYFGPAPQAPGAFARLNSGLDETIVRLITARPGPGPVIEAMTALTPAAIHAA